MFFPQLLCSLILSAAVCVCCGCASSVSRNSRGSNLHPADDPASISLDGNQAADLISMVSYSAPQPRDPENQYRQDPEPGNDQQQESATATGLTLDQLEQLALANNPAIRQAASNAARARGIRLQVGLKPNPTIGYFGEEMGNDGTGGLHGGFVSQTVIRGEKLEWNRQVLNQSVNALNCQIATQRQKVLTDVRIAFFQALSAEQRIQLAEEFRDVAEQAVAIATEQFEARIGTRPDVLQSEIQLSEVELSIQTARFERIAAMRELGALTGVADFDVESLTGDFGQGLESRDEELVFAQIVAASPALAAARAQVARTRANLQRQQVQPTPNVTAQFGAGGDDATGDAFANLQLSVPLPIHNNNQGNVRAARAEYCAAVQNVERMLAKIRQDLARVMYEYNAANATVQRYEQAILPRARQTMELMEEARDAGEFDFLRVLTARRAYFDANQTYIAALANRAQAKAKLDGQLLMDGFSEIDPVGIGDGLRGQALNGQ